MKPRPRSATMRWRSAASSSWPSDAAVQRLGLDVAVAAARAIGEIQVDGRRLGPVAGAGGVEREPGQPDAVVELGARSVEAERGGVHLGAQPVRDRLLDRGAQQRVAERRAPAALPLEDPHRHQLAGRHVRVHPQVGVEPLVRAAAGCVPARR